MNTNCRVYLVIAPR